ncbi:DUF262 domain-containing protein [Chitinophaga pendula]|uniref:DUF262 domain-containing protein n=1 Tax=Chitinophaga TaxID=79328 RepID=UPI000BAF1364|nr:MULTISPECIES: DUF262 domain-containing protein [Chitinophaga]ASZ11039.1 hypothetical protein CK934_08725 [Chitinophaga sp. MD30]UCJ05964.1 DUF262 domain-containing protein [Chitinophaga pendula]
MKENVPPAVLSVRAFLCDDRLCIPEFQRPYKWTVHHVVQLMEDVQRFAPEVIYRIGTIVIYENENGQYEIVDGQQRTITFFLLLKAISETSYAAMLDDILIACLHRFTLSDSDISKGNILRNYREMERRSAQIDGTFIHYFLDRCEVAVFVLDDISEAFQFFDSQHARGKDLAPHDLLKAFHLREMEGEDEEKMPVVMDWEHTLSDELSTLFAAYLYRVRGWIKGYSSRAFTKQEVAVFKGMRLKKAQQHPYGRIYQMADAHLMQHKSDLFPFQLDQPIINGKYFFKMVSHYRDLCHTIVWSPNAYLGAASDIIALINNYEGVHRIGDQHVRLLFDCGLLYYVDRFGREGLPKAIEKIFIWAYTPRLKHSSVSIATVDNYVVYEFNLFKVIQEAVSMEDVHLVDLPLLTNRHETTKAPAIKAKFETMKYYV